MEIKYDYHIHTTNSFDGKANMEEHIRDAIDKGFHEICFTEHMDFCEFLKPPGLDFLDMEKYYEEFSRLKEKYLDKINIKFGLEAGLQSHTRKTVSEFVNKYDFDFVIGSLHVWEGDDFGHPDSKFFENCTQREAYIKYLSEIVKIVENYNDEFDVFGHLDYVIRYGDFEKQEINYAEYKEWIDKILIGLIEKGRGIEINAARI